MDHNYRNGAEVNGNVADHRPPLVPRTYAEADYAPGNVGAAAPVSNVEGPTRIFAFIEDLFLLAKINEVARKLGTKVEFVKTAEPILERAEDEIPEEERPALIMIDLNNPNVKPLTLIPKLRQKLKKSTSIVGFLNHLQGDLKVKALESGCDQVVPRSAFSQNLPNLLRRHTEEEA